MGCVKCRSLRCAPLPPCFYFYGGLQVSSLRNVLLTYKHAGSYREEKMLSVFVNLFAAIAYVSLFFALCFSSLLSPALLFGSRKHGCALSRCFDEVPRAFVHVFPTFLSSSSLFSGLLLQSRSGRPALVAMRFSLWGRCCKWHA